MEELFDGKVCRLDHNDFWAYIDFNGKRIVYGFSSDWKALFADVKTYASLHTPKNSLVEVGVIRRSFLGLTQPVVVTAQINHNEK